MEPVLNSVVFTERMTGSSAWTSSDFTGEDDWTVHLTRADLAELDAVLGAIRSGRRDMAELTRTDFPLPGLGPRLEEFVHELEHGRGFGVIRGLPIERYSLAEAKLLYWGIGCHLGDAVGQNASGDLMVHVTDHGRGDLSAATTRGYQTRSALPFHTDSADIVGLLCLSNAGSGGMSTLSSSMTVHNHFLEHHRELLGILYAGFLYDRRGEEGPGEPPVYRNAVYGWFDERLSCRYYLPTFIESAQAKTGLRLSAVERLTLATFETVAGRPGHRIDMALQPGDIQLLNNNVVLHGRTAYEDGHGRKRDLLRLWLNTRQARRLPEEFAKFRFGMPVTAPRP
jgi:hypothetical protein